MRAYVMTTGVIFGLLAVAHLWRVVGENRQLATDPFFLAITVTAALLCLWAARLVWRSSRP